ncbi:MAG: hypothetical protein ABIC04_02140 [Nanoarchaeota archaeon]
MLTKKAKMAIAVPVILMAGESAYEILTHVQPVIDSAQEMVHSMGNSIDTVIDLLINPKELAGSALEFIKGIPREIKYIILTTSSITTLGICLLREYKDSQNRDRPLFDLIKPLISQYDDQFQSDVPTDKLSDAYMKRHRTLFEMRIAGKKGNQVTKQAMQEYDTTSRIFSKRTGRNHAKNYDALQAAIEDYAFVPFSTIPEQTILSKLRDAIYKYRDNSKAAQHYDPQTGIPPDDSSPVKYFENLKTACQQIIELNPHFKMAQYYLQKATTTLQKLQPT